MNEPDPAAAFTRLNSLIMQSGIAGRFVTLVAAILDPARHTATLVNAGHPSPLIYHGASGSAEAATSIDVAGFPLGVIEGFQYTSCQVCLEPGDGILAFTDGVIEAMDIKGLQLQTAGVYAAVQARALSPRALGERVVQVVRRFAAGQTQRDDITLVGFGRVEL